MIRVIAFGAVGLLLYALVRRKPARKPGPRLEPSQQPLDLRKFEGTKR